MITDSARRFRTGPDSPHWPPAFAAHLEVPAGNAAANLEASALRWPTRPALHYYGQTTSYTALQQQVLALSGYLQHLGIRQGDRVLLYMQNAPQYVIAFHAILRANAVVVPVNPMNTTEELRHYL